MSLIQRLSLNLLIKAEANSRRRPENPGRKDQLLINRQHPGAINDIPSRGVRISRIEIRGSRVAVLNVLPDLIDIWQ
jgi:hypothetical protein